MLLLGLNEMTIDHFGLVPVPSFFFFLSFLFPFFFRGKVLPESRSRVSLELDLAGLVCSVRQISQETRWHRSKHRTRVGRTSRHDTTGRNHRGIDEL